MTSSDTKEEAFKPFIWLNHNGNDIVQRMDTCGRSRTFTEINEKINFEKLSVMCSRVD